MSKCTDSGAKVKGDCVKTHDDGFESCGEYRDDGYNACDRWDKNCCDWWPCSWACKIISWVCTGWFWISNVVCVFMVWISKIVCIAWSYIITAVCVAVDVIVMVAGAVIETLESLVGWVLSAIAFVIEFILSIPIIGRLVAWVLAVVQTIVWLVVGFWDTIAGLLGIRPEKKLRICTIILADESGQPIVSAAAVVPWLQKAMDVFKEEANVRVVPVAPFQYSSAFADNATVTESWIHVSTDPSKKQILDLGGEAATLGADLTDIGSDYNKLAMMHCFYGTWRKVVGYGAPITVFVIRSLEEGVARSLGPLTDYVVVAGQDPQGTPDVTDVAHEMGHTCYLVWHSTDSTNLMLKGSPRGTQLDWWQTTLLRSSRHVTYF